MLAINLTIRGKGMNKKKLADDFTEIVAMRIHARDQMSNGVMPPYSVTKGWRRRYTGTPPDQLPPNTVEINHFKTEVDQFVSMLMQAVDDIN